jgi:transcriptional regulator with XRE-family HTH domain
MTLSEFMKERGYTDEALAAAVAVSRSHATRLRLKQRRPSIVVATAIEEWSGGLVKATSFVGGNDERPRAVDPVVRRLDR